MNLSHLSWFVAYFGHAESGLLAYWDFEEGLDSAILYDLSNSSYNGLLSGAIWSADGPVYSLRPGDIDASFGTDGKAFADLGSADDPRDIALQSDGKIIVVGPYDGFKVVRFNKDGTLDLSFDTDGMATVDISGGTGHPGGAASVAIQSDGKIVVGGSYDPGVGQKDFVLIRLNGISCRKEIPMGLDCPIGKE